MSFVVLVHVKIHYILPFPLHIPPTLHSLLATFSSLLGYLRVRPALRTRTSSIKIKDMTCAFQDDSCQLACHNNLQGTLKREYEKLDTKSRNKVNRASSKDPNTSYDVLNFDTLSHDLDELIDVIVTNHVLTMRLSSSTVVTNPRLPTQL